MRIVIPREQLAEAAGMAGYFDGERPKPRSGGYQALFGWDEPTITYDDWMLVAMKLEGVFARPARRRFDCREGDIALDVPDEPSFLLLP